MHTQKIHLPEIKDNDLVIVSDDGCTSLFYSDGKVAQTYLEITDLEAELAKVEVPESVKEEARKSTYDEYGRVFSGKFIEDLAAGRISDATEWYKQDSVIEKGISEGYLKEVVDRFGMNAQLKHIILRNHNTPFLLFGTRGDVLDLGIRTHAWKFGEVSCEEVLPNFHSRSPEYIDIPVHQFQVAVVGPENIKNALRVTPQGTVLSSYLTKNGVLP